MADYGDVLAAYALEYPLYQRLAAYVASELQAAIKAAGLYTMPVTGRAKDPRSFAIKACIGRKYAQPLQEIKDKAGIRVIVFYQRDLDRVVEVIGNTFQVLSMERKLDALEYDQNGYLGTHLEAQLSGTQLTTTQEGYSDRPFEVQVRTMAQSAWAEVSHAQLYKPPADVPNELKRQIYRLVALVELIDNEVEAFRLAAEQTQGYREAATVADMVEALAKLGNSRAPNRHLTLELSAAIVPLYERPPARIEALLKTFVGDNETGLRNVIAEGEAEETKYLNPLLAQPELPMICERLERDRVNLEQAWPTAVPQEWLDDLAEKWGVGRAPH